MGVRKFPSASVILGFLLYLAMSLSQFGVVGSLCIVGVPVLIIIVTFTL